MKKFFALTLSILLIFIAGCGNDKKNSAAENKTVESSSTELEKNSGKKILVAYFSRKGTNYEVGFVEKGNTHIVADMIAEKVGADMFEIKTVKPYPEDYKECTEVAKQELATNARPEIVGKIENFDQYETIFLGYPVWWSDLPAPVYTFLESYDWKGKTIIPFCTAGGDYMTDKENEIPQFAKDATVKEGIGIRGKICQEDPETVRTRVNAWLKNLRF